MSLQKDHILLVTHIEKYAPSFWLIRIIELIFLECTDIALNATYHKS